jgi:hypothetical protein
VRQAWPFCEVILLWVKMKMKKKKKVKNAEVKKEEVKREENSKNNTSCKLRLLTNQLAFPRLGQRL